MLAHELGHWASRVVYCDRNGRAKTCTYKGQHNPSFYRVLSEIHRALGTPKKKAKALETRAGYHPPDGWMSDQASTQTRRRSPKRSSRSKSSKSSFLSKLLQAAAP